MANLLGYDGVSAMLMAKRTIAAIIILLLIGQLLPVAGALSGGAGEVTISGPASITAGTSRQFSASSQAGGKFKWASSDEKALYISRSGKAAARKVSSPVKVLLSATDATGARGEIEVTVYPAASKVAVSPASVTLDPGSKPSAALSASVSPGSAAQSVTWRSSKPDVASVNASGVVTAKKKGSAVIYATSTDGSKRSGSCRVTVKTLAVGVSIAGPAELRSGKSAALTPTIIPSGAGRSLVWKSSNTKAATVSSSGKVSAKKVDRRTVVTISAATKDGTNIVATHSITVIPAADKVVISQGGRSASSLRLDTRVNRMAALSAAVSPSEAPQGVVWRSSNTKVAVVDSAGNVTARAKGKANITATAADGSKKKATIKVEVVELVESISLSGANVLPSGRTATLKAGVSPKGANNKKLAWQSSNPSAASVSQSGKVSAGKVSARTEVTITAAANDGSGVRGTYKIMVVPVAGSVSVECGGEPVKEYILDLGGQPTASFVAAVAPLDASQSVTWKSSNTKVVSIDKNGRLTAYKRGTANITATAADGTGKKCSVKVTVGVRVSKIVIGGASSVTAGRSVKLSASVLPGNADNRAVVWSSSDSSRATVSKDGRVSARSAGAVVITASSTDGSKVYGERSINVVPLTEGSALPLAGLKVGIDPGHQGKHDYSMEPVAPGSKTMKHKVGSGTAGIKTRASESTVNLKIGLMLRDRLEELGAEVMMTRVSQNVNVSNIERAVMMNNWGADIVLRLHCNSSTNRNTNGICLYVKSGGEGSDESYRIACELLTSMAGATGANGKGISRSKVYTGLNWSTVPSILVEMGYMSNPDEDVKLSSASYQKKLVEGMARGLADYFGREYPAEK